MTQGGLSQESMLRLEEQVLPAVIILLSEE